MESAAFSSIMESIHPGNISTDDHSVDINSIGAFNSSDLMTYIDDENATMYGSFESVVRSVNKYGLPVIVFGGLIGNGLSFIVLTSKHIKDHSTSVYLAFLNVVDSLFLLFLLSGWLGWFKFYLFHQNGWCQFTIYISYVTSFLSAWGVVSFTVERYIAVYHPFKKITLCSKTKTIKTVVGLSIGALMLYSYNIVINGVVNFANQGDLCVTFRQYDFFARIMSGVDTVITLVLPSVVIVLFNFAIAVKLWRVTISKRENFSYRRTETSGMLESSREVEMECLASTASNSDNNRSESMLMANHPDGSRHAMRMCLRTTRSLLIVSTVFVALNLPSHSLRIHLALHYLINTDTSDTDYLQRWQQILQFISYINYSANFFLYCACSQSFRTGLRRLCLDKQSKCTKASMIFLKKGTRR